MADINSLAQQIAFLQAGGKEPGNSFADQFNQGAGMVNGIIGNVLATKKALLDQKKSQAETAHLGAETQKTGAEAQKLNIANTPMSKYQIPGNGGGTAGVNGQILPGQGEPTLDMSQMTPDQQDIMSQTNLRNAQAEAARRKSAEQPAGKHYIIDKITGQVIDIKDGTPGSKDSFTLVGNKPEDTLPTYKKSELLAMSPEERAGLGKYKVVDDTAPNKNTDDNQTADEILSGLQRLTEIRKTMGNTERGAATVPGIAQVGKLVSAPLASWNTEKNLLAQRLGKLFERNRMSDEDRNFYLKQFSSPIANDAAFDANVNALKRQLDDIKNGNSVKPGTAADNSGNNLLQTLINKHK